MEKTYKVDLHIHSFNSLKRKSGDKGKIAPLDKNSFVEVVNKIDAEVISITDHNIFDYDLYKTILEQTDKIVFPGVELDLHIEKDKKPFHALVIFDPSKSKVFNQIMSQPDFGITSDGKSLNESSDKSFSFIKLIHRLQDIKEDVMIIPHFGSKSNNIENAIKNLFNNEPRNMPYVSDRHNLSWIARPNFDALEISNSEDTKRINQMLVDLNVNMAAISFSDCHNLNSYPDKQNFLIPEILFDGTFRDLKYALSDPIQRIFHNDIPKKNKIDAISYNGEVIRFSSHLNVIIGPRGSGKSMLIDVIMSKISNRAINDKYKDINYDDIYVVGNHPQKEQVLFLEQGKLSGDEILTNKGLEKALKSHNIDLENIKSYDKVNTDNIDDLVGGIEYIFNISKSTLTEEYDLSEFKSKVSVDNNGSKSSQKFSKDLENYIKNNKNDKDVIRKAMKLTGYDNLEEIKSLLAQLKEFDMKLFDEYSSTNSKFNNTLLEYQKKLNYKDKWSSKISTFFVLDDNSKFELVKSNAIASFENAVKKELLINNAINDSLVFDEEIKKEYEAIQNSIDKQFDIDENTNNDIMFNNEYIKLFDGTYNFKSNISNVVDLNLPEALKRFKKNRKMNKGSKDNADKFIFDFRAYERTNDVTSVWDGNLKKLGELSPGQKGKIIVSFILDKLTSKYTTIIIDQPEDNLDPGTITKTLVSRIRREKWKRQFIIVTHSPLLAINADANKVIIPEIIDNNELSIEESGSPYKEGVKKIILDILEGSGESFEHRMDRNKFTYKSEKGYKVNEFKDKIWR